MREAVEVFETREADLCGELPGFDANFCLEAFHESLEVDAVCQATVEDGGGPGEIDGGGDGDRSKNVLRGPGFAKVFEDEVAAEAASDQGDGAISGMGNNFAKVAGGAAVVGAGEAVGPAGAAAVVPGKDIPAGACECQCGAHHARIARATLEPVAQDGQPGMPVLQPIEVEEIPIGKIDAFAAEGGTAGNWCDGR